MRKPLIVLALVGAFSAATVPAFAAPPSPVPSIPQDCHEWNELLHLQNVRSCDGDPQQ